MCDSAADEQPLTTCWRTQLHYIENLNPSLLSPSCPLSSPLLLYFLCLVHTSRVLDWKMYSVNNLNYLLILLYSVFSLIYFWIILNVSSIHLFISVSSQVQPGHLYLPSCSFGYYAKLMTIGEHRNDGQLVNWEVCLSAQVSLHHNR